MMREAYQKVRAAKAENNIPDLRTAAYKVALDQNSYKLRLDWLCKTSDGKILSQDSQGSQASNFFMAYETNQRIQNSQVNY